MQYCANIVITDIKCIYPVKALIFFRFLLSNCLNGKFTAMIILHFHRNYYYINIFSKVKLTTERSLPLYSVFFLPFRRRSLIHHHPCTTTGV